MPGTDSNSGRCSLLYHSLNSGTSLASISTYTIKIPRPLCGMFPISSVKRSHHRFASSRWYPVLTPGAQERHETTNWAAILADIPQIQEFVDSTDWISASIYDGIWPR